MKRLPILLLCFLLLFCIGCQKEEKADPELGSRYVSGGDVYNTHIRLRLVTEELEAPKTVVSELRAPVNSLTFEIQNDTDYYVNLGRLASEWSCEKWENGEWVIMPEAHVYTIPDVQQSAKFKYVWLEPHSKKTFTEDYVLDDPSAIVSKNAHHLTEGVYRMKHTVLLTKEQTTGGEEYTVEVYFAVAPSLD
jgi:hypothetical protein